jgi:hypothetical protein
LVSVLRDCFVCKGEVKVVVVFAREGPGCDLEGIKRAREIGGFCFRDVARYARFQQHAQILAATVRRVHSRRAAKKSFSGWP